MKKVNFPFTSFILPSQNQITDIVVNYRVGRVDTLAGSKNPPDFMTDVGSKRHRTPLIINSNFCLPIMSIQWQRWQVQKMKLKMIIK